MSAYYNEFDPYAAQWLRNLIAKGLIAPGDVDERSIIEVQPDDLRGYTQCHFFAGLGGWSYALRLAGWPDDQPVWTGSAPCQPFSSAGKGQADEDDRHLAPVWLRLIGECRPATIFGEQVGAAIRVGWLDALFVEMEQMHYACGAVDFPACSVGAPHIRQRLYFVADRDSRRRGERGERDCDTAQPEQFAPRGDNAGGCRPTGELAYTGRDEQGAGRGDAGEVRGFPHEERGQPGLEGLTGHGDDGDEPGRLGADEAGSVAEAGRAGFWSACDWLPCRDGKARPVEPGTFPLAHGVAARVVYTCAICKTETVADEKMRILRKIAQGHEGLLPSAFLLNGVLLEVDNRHADDSNARALSGAIQICSDLLRAVRQQEVSRPSSQRRQRDEQCLREYRDSLPSMPRQGTQSTSHADMQSLPQTIQGSALEEQHLFCPVCAGVGPHLREQEVGGSRVGKLRAAGNAIVPQQATEFIKAAM